MFTTIVAWAAFVALSIVLVGLLYEGLRPRSKTEETLDNLKDYQRGYSTQTDWRKVGVIVAIWFGAGWYLFG